MSTPTNIPTMTSALPLNGRTEIVFVENNVADYQSLLGGLATGTEVHVLDASRSGLEQMAQIMAGRSDVDAIHVVSHGAEGSLQLGALTLTAQNMQEHGAELTTISSALRTGADILLYGCDVAKGEAGINFIGKLAQLTHADVAASNNLTGASALGGDWVLETHSGLVNSTALTLDAYMGTLALTVTNNFATELGTPQDLAIDSQNNLYVVSYDDNALKKFNASGGAITGGGVSTVFATMTNAACVAIDSTGNLYLGTGNGTITQYPASGGIPSNVGGTLLASGFNNISDIVVGSDGYLYVADSGANKVYKLGASGGPFTPASTPISATVNGVQQLYIDATNNLYATSPDDGKVVKFAAASGAISLANSSDFVTGLSDEPRSITSDGTNFYIGTGPFGGDGKIYKTGADGGVATPESTFASTQVTELLCTGSNTLYGTFSDNMVRKLVIPAPNTAPTITSGDTGSVSENSSLSVVAYTATATDAEGSPITYSLSGTDKDLLNINGSTGVVKLNIAANYEAKSSYSFNVVASDGSLSSSKPVTINVIDVNENTVFSGAASGSVAENAPTSTVVYTVMATDPEGAAVTYALGGTDAASFNINSTTGAITLKASANYETKSSYTLNLMAMDGVNTALKVITVAVTNVNEKPAITAPTSQNVTQATATAITGISVADPDSGSNMITMSFSAPAGTFAATSGSSVTVLGSGTSSLTLSGTQTNINSFITASKLSYTSAAGASGTVTLSIGTNDGGNSGSGGTQTDSKTETLNIQIPNAAPVISSGATGSVAENAATSTVVYTAAATDADNDSITYSLTGTDAASFSIDGSTGAVTLQNSANYEVKNSYSITVNATDASHATPTSKAVTISVTDVNEAPTDLALSANSVAENTSTVSALTIGALSSTDPDTGNTFTYSIVGGVDQTSFQISGSDLQFKAGTVLDYETKNSYAVTVRTTDQGGLAYDKALTVNLTNVNEKPVITAPASQNVTQATATAITGITIVDPDSGSNVITMSFSAPAGTFTATSGSSVTVLGSGTSSLTLSGTQTNINSFITASKLSYTSAAGASGTVTLSIGTNDGGNSGSGGTQTDSKTETLTIVVPPPPSTPSSPSASSSSATTSQQVDGVMVETSSQSGSNGQVITTQTVTPVTNARSEDRHTEHGNLADIPVATDSSGVPLIQVGLPVGIGFTSESVTTSGTVQTLRERLITASTPHVDGDAPMQEIINNGIDQYVPSVGDQSQVTVRTVTLSVAAGMTTAPTTPIVIRGTTGAGEDDAAHPQRGEALVIDARKLPAGSVIDLSLVEFAIVVGQVTVTGGTGRNFVIGDGSTQVVTLGMGDDIAHGGAAADTLGGGGGNDHLYGDAGNDWAVGGTGNDVLEGGDGNDILQGGPSDAGAWNFTLTPQGQLQVSFVPGSSDLADMMGFNTQGRWVSGSGKGLITDDRFAWVYDDYAVAKDVSLLVEALVGRLPTLKEMGVFADGQYTSQQLGAMAHAYWLTTSGNTEQSLAAQVQAVINKAWGANSATPDLVNLGVNHLTGGGSWADVWLALARYSTNANRITDEQGGIKLISGSGLGETGWSFNSGNDTLQGGAGNDVLIGGNGNDVLDGGTGMDVAVFFGQLTDYEAALHTNTTTGQHDVLVRNKVTGEVDTMRNVEMLKMGSTVYYLPPGHPQPANDVYVPLASYLTASTAQEVTVVGFNTSADLMA